MTGGVRALALAVLVAGGTALAPAVPAGAQGLLPLVAKKLPPPPKVKGPTGAVAVHVTFDGSGSYTWGVDAGTFEGSGDATGRLSFRFRTRYLVPSPGGKIGEGPGVPVDWQASATSETRVSADGGSLDQQCPTVPVDLSYEDNPHIVTVGGSVHVQSVVQAKEPAVPSCQTTIVPPPGAPVVVPTLLSPTAVVSAFNGLALPDSVAAVLPGGAARLPYGVKRTYPVSSSGAPPPKPCPSDAPGCVQKLFWSGTVTIEGVCAKGDALSAKLPWCVDKKDAIAAAKRYRKEYLQDRDEIRRVFRCGAPSQGKKAYAKPILSCLVVGVKDGWDYNHMLDAQKAAADPPDDHYGQVARPRPLPQPALQVLRHTAPAFAALARLEGRAIGDERAVLTAMNRSTGASYAILDGDQQAMPALARQKQAILKAARGAARLLAHRNGAARRAARELRHIASLQDRQGRGAATRALRRVAASLAGGAARRNAHAQVVWLRRFG